MCMKHVDNRRKYQYYEDHYGSLSSVQELDPQAGGSTYQYHITHICKNHGDFNPDFQQDSGINLAPRKYYCQLP